jgi:hypothetical protein
MKVRDEGFRKAQSATQILLIEHGRYVQLHQMIFLKDVLINLTRKDIY